MSYHVSSMALRQSRSVQRNRNRISSNSAVSRLGPISNILILAVILSILGLIYLTQITKTNSLGYQANALETKKTELIEEQQSLQVESARLQALERIRTSKVAKNLTPSNSVDYIR